MVAVSEPFLSPKIAGTGKALRHLLLDGLQEAQKWQPVWNPQQMKTL